MVNALLDHLVCFLETINSYLVKFSDYLEKKIREFDEKDRDE